jgi:hypothetical protein
MHSSSSGRRWAANTLLAAALLLCAALAILPAGYFPACPIHQLFGIDCPGCGATRALAALLHGHPIAALRLNALFVLLLPLALAGAIESYRRAIRPGPFSWPQPPAPALYATFAVTAIFTIARNLPR